MRILYIIHVDWRWIKQRPQFLAEELSVHYLLQVLDRRSPLFKGQFFRNGPFSLLPLLPLPWSWPVIRIVTNCLQKIYVALLLRKFRPDLIWLTYPSLLAFIPGTAAELPVVYDCMDDALGFAVSHSRQLLIERMERQLVSRAASIFCSSENLKEVLLARYGTEWEHKTHVVRNGISDLLLKASESSSKSSTNGARARVVYTGTIAEWMNFPLLVDSLQQHSNLEYHLVGPYGSRNLPSHERLVFHGAVPHSDLPRLVEEFDALVMPFVVTPLIASVDPVKLYEYISYGKPIISVYYKEIRRFDPYVYFYHQEQEFHTLIARLVRGDLPLLTDDDSRRRFLQENTWSNRCGVIREQIDSLVNYQEGVES